jgi:hypothetical protein
LFHNQLTNAIGGQAGTWAHEPEVPDLHESRGVSLTTLSSRTPKSGAAERGRSAY